VVLCAKRAGNTGLPVLVAISTEPADDQIEICLRQSGVSCFRGSHHDVLKRFVDASIDMPESATIVRLTADNVFPDGSFIEELINELTRRSLEYLGTSSPADGLPYGLSAEAFSVRALRRAHKSAESASDREHVTPWMRRTIGEQLFRPSHLEHDLSHLRCTIDTFDDYQRVASIINGIDNPIAAPWQSLCEKLKGLPGQPTFRVPFVRKGPAVHSALTLGTVQLGMRYGIANTSGRPSLEDACSMVRVAIAHGITALDTARAYGDSEGRIGRALAGGLESQVTVITKLDPLAEITETDPDQAIRNAVDASVFRSCTELKTKTIDTLLLHRWQHRSFKNGLIWEHLKSLRNQGFIRKLGASVRDPTEAMQALVDPDVGHIQLPFNMLDWRWRVSGIEKAVQRCPDVVVHARSVFLQGILLCGHESWPGVPDLDAAAILSSIELIAKRLGRKGRADLCIAYARGHSWITSLVIGMETLAQLYGNMELFRNAPLSADETALVDRELPKVPEQLLDPSRWPAVG